MGLVLFGACLVVVGFILSVYGSAAVYHSVGKGVVALSGDGYVGGGCDSTGLIADVKHGYSCPESIIELRLVSLVVTAVATGTRHSFELG